MRLVSGPLLQILALCLIVGHQVYGCQEGEVSKVPESCDEYNKCINGLFVRRRCETGQYFDGIKCDDFWKVKCNKKPCVEGMIYNRGFCVNDYDVCYQGRLRNEICPPLYSYDGTYCVPMETCKDTANSRCRNGEVQDAYGSSYMECVEGEYELKLCEDGYIFVKETKSCQPVGINLASEQRGFCTENDRRPLPNCQKYEECIKGHYQERTCPPNMLFDKYFHMCRSYFDATCDDKSCVNEQLSPNLEDCDSYYTCSDGEQKSESCGWFKHFDPVYQECTYGKNCDRTPCKGDYVQVSDDCSKYTLCKNGYKVSYSCPWLQKYNPKNGGCKLGATCETPNAFILLNEEKCIDGQTDRVFGRCTEFKKCKNGKWKVMKCPQGLNFQEDSCEKKPCPLEPVLNHCSLFKQPGSDKQFECPFGYLFDREVRQCVYNAAARCAVGECIDNEVTHHPTDCNKYKTCQKGKWTINSCPAIYSHFDINEKQCKFWKYTCGYDPASCKDDEMKPEPTSCKQYLQCKDKSWRTNNCWFWQHFDALNNVCATFSYQCYEPPKQITVEKSVITKPKNKNSNTLMNNQILASGCKEGEKKLVDNTCRWYTECQKGEVLTKKCSACKNFNQDLNGCDWVWKKPCKPGVTDPPDFTTSPTPTSSTSPKPVCKNGDKEGVKNDCQSYIECVKGQWAPKKCNTVIWGKFDVVTKDCFYFLMYKVTCA